MKKFLIALIMLALAGGNAMVYSQDGGELNAIHSVVPFLTIAPDSRAGAMGDAGVATTPDVYSLHWNPAKFVFIDGNGGVGISYSPWLRNLVPDINIAQLSAYKRLDARQVFAASLLYSSLGDVPFTDESGNYLSTFRPNEFALDAAYSRLFSDHFSGGIAFRFIYSNLTGGMYSGGEATKPGTSFAADVSGYYQNKIDLGGKNGTIAAGLNFSNIGSKMSYSDNQTSDFIPMNFRIGSALNVDLDEHNSLGATFDINKLLVPTPPIYDESGNIVKGRDPNVSVPVAFFTSWFDAPGGFKEEFRELTFSPGIEYLYNRQFAIRGGYFHENQTKGNRKYFTAGAGFKLKQFTLDFSYLMPLAQNHPLARTLRFSLAFDFNSGGTTSTN
ncbi:MAG TPA: type IX secretion system outer membrane channel protein PorV [Bacteroidales bacterium]|nr:type IX secretion system outer membrane channel protein PorV [Bacteroidales bacterium]